MSLDPKLRLARSVTKNIAFHTGTCVNDLYVDEVTHAV